MGFFQNMKSAVDGFVSRVKEGSKKRTVETVVSDTPDQVKQSTDNVEFPNSVIDGFVSGFVFGLKAGMEDGGKKTITEIVAESISDQMNQSTDDDDVEFPDWMKNS